jgi:hypothetical protein
MACGTGAGSDKTNNAFGLPYGHAYSLIGAYVVTDAAGVKHNLIHVRNPHGEDQKYNATWNDGDSAHWTADV